MIQKRLGRYFMKKTLPIEMSRNSRKKTKFLGSLGELMNRRQEKSWSESIMVQSESRPVPVAIWKINAAPTEAPNEDCTVTPRLAVSCLFSPAHCYYYYYCYSS